MLFLAPVTVFAAFVWTVDSGSSLSTSLVAAYNLESSAGTDDKSGVTLTLNGSPTFGAGKNGNAVDFGSSNTTKWFTQSGNNFGIDGGNASISAWVNIDSAPSSGASMAIAYLHSATSKTSYAIYYTNNAGTLTVQFSRIKDGVAVTSITSATTLTIGTWHHLVITYDSTNIEGWLDGSSVGTIAASGNGSAGATNFFSIGSDDPTASSLLSGKVDAVYVWSKKLSNTEVSDLYSAGSGSFYNAPFAGGGGDNSLGWFMFF